MKSIKSHQHDEQINVFDTGWYFTHILDLICSVFMIVYRSHYWCVYWEWNSEVCVKLYAGICVRSQISFKGSTDLLLKGQHWKQTLM